MADGIQFDFSDINKLAADLGRAGDKVVPNVVKAVAVTALRVKEDWRKNAAAGSGSHAKYYPASISYDLELDKNDEIGAEIGPKPGGRWAQGSLGILEDASGGVQSKPQNAGRDALKANQADFIKGLEKAAEDVL